jgi:hypothetical protein
MFANRLLADIKVLKELSQQFVLAKSDLAYYYKRITSLRTVIAIKNSLDKEAASNDDVLDTYQLSLKNYKFVVRCDN